MTEPTESPEWTTSVLAGFHAVLFEPNDDVGGERNAVGVQIPETPPHLIAQALTEATNLKARVMFLCDTQQQAIQIAADAEKMLPKHHRIAIERAAGGGWGALIR